MEMEEIIRTGNRNVRIRKVTTADAERMLVYLKQVSDETPYMIRYPDEVRSSVEEERAFLEKITSGGRNFMLAALELNEDGLDGRIAGNVGVNAIGSTEKVCHRASLGIALIQEYCGIGLGRILMEKSIALASELGYTQMELGVFENNERALQLYRKMGFSEVGRIPNAFRLRTGEQIAEIQMVKGCQK